MFRLSQIKLWRNISITILLIAIIFTIIGAFTIRGDLIVHWSSAGVPNSSSGKWILWVMLLLAFLSREFPLPELPVVALYQSPERSC